MKKRMIFSSGRVNTQIVNAYNKKLAWDNCQLPEGLTSLQYFTECRNVIKQNHKTFKSSD